VAATSLASRHGGLSPWAPAEAELGVAACACGFMLAVGSVAPALLRFAERPAARADTTVRLALTNLVREPRRPHPFGPSATAVLDLPRGTE